MLARVTSGTKRMFGLYHPRRDLKIFTDDVFLVSFPKSGNTWTRFLIANLLSPERNADFATIRKLVPDPFGTNKRDFERMPRPRVIKSHECFDPRYPRAIYIVRDPRDVVISQYHYHRKCRKIEDNYALDKFVDRFLAGKTCPHGSWGEHVITWLTTRHDDPRFLLIRYEDMIADGVRELGRIASFLGIDATPQLLAQAVDRSSADKMRKLEKEQSHISGLTKDSRKDLPFVRAANSGGWRSNLPAPLAAQIEAAWAPQMRYLRYELTTSAQTQVSAKLLLGALA
jgi:sulfotransferase family protein